MILENFINYERICPVCNNQLTFFIVFDSINPTLWKIEKQKKQYKLIINNVHRLSVIPKKDNTYQFVNNNKNNYSFNNNHSQYYLIGICNQSAIKIKENELFIDFSNVCFYRKSPHLDKCLNVIDNTGLITICDFFCFSETGIDFKKIYNIEFDYIRNSTKITYFLLEKNKRISKFEKEFDFILTMITKDLIKDQTKLIDKINTWITFS